MPASSPVPLPTGGPASLRGQLHRWASSAPMRDLVAAFGGDLPPAGPAGLLDWLADFSARHWDFRTARRVERHEVTAPDLPPAQRAAVARAAEALGFVRPLPAPLRSYDHVLVLGGMAGTCLRRSEHAARLLSDGVRTPRVTALGSFRPLGAEERTLVPAPYEVDALETGLRSAFGVTSPARSRGSAGPITHESWAVRELPSSRPLLRVLAAPSSDPSVRRANTADTYRFWAEDAQPAGTDRILVVTSAIYVPFQHCDAIRLLTLPYGCPVDTVGLDPGVPVGADRYLQEIRSAVHSMRSLLHEL